MLARATPLAETDVDPRETVERYSAGGYAGLVGRHDGLFG